MQDAIILASNIQDNKIFVIIVPIVFAVFSIINSIYVNRYTKFSKTLLLDLIFITLVGLILGFAISYWKTTIDYNVTSISISNKVEEYILNNTDQNNKRIMSNIASTKGLNSYDLALALDYKYKTTDFSKLQEIIEVKEINDNILLNGFNAALTKIKQEVNEADILKNIK